MRLLSCIGVYKDDINLVPRVFALGERNTLVYIAWSRDPRILRKMAYFLLGSGEYTLSLLVIIIDNY